MSTHNTGDGAAPAAPPIHHASAPAAVPLGMESKTPLPPAGRLPYSRWRVARAGGVGAACGLMLVVGLLGPDSILHHGSAAIWRFLLIAGIMLVVGFSIIEPFLEWVHHGGEDHGDHAGETRGARKASRRGRLAGTLIFVALAAVFALLEDVVRESLLVREGEFISMWIGAFAVGAVVTYAWVRGAYRGPPYATVYGTLAGVGVGFLTALVIQVIAVARLHAAGGTILTSVAGDWMLLHFLMAVYYGIAWSLAAFAGGAAIDFGRGIPPAFRVAIAFAAVWVVVAVMLPAIDEHPLVRYGDAARALGWAAALCLYPVAHVALATRRQPFTPSWAVVGASLTAVAGVTAVCALVLFGIGRVIGARSAGAGEFAAIPGAVGPMSVSHDGRYLATSLRAALSGRPLWPVYVFDLEAGSEPRGEHRRLLGHSARVLDACFVGHDILRTVGADGSVREWDIPRGLELRSIGLGLDKGYRIVDGLFSAHGDEVLLTVEVTSRPLQPGGKESVLPPIGYGGIALLRIKPVEEVEKELTEARRLAAAGKTPPAVEEFVSIEARELTLGPPVAIALASHGRYAIATRNGGVALFSQGDEQPQFIGAVKGNAVLAASPDGTLLAAAGADNRVLLYTLPAAHASSGHGGHARVDAADRMLLAHAQNPAAAHAAPAALSPKELGTMKTHVNALAFSPDGSRLLAGSAGGEVKVWQVPAGKLLDDHSLAVSNVEAACMRSNRRAVTGGGDGLIVRWTLSP